MSNKVRVRVPGSTGNLGSGYDCIGMALGLYNTVIFTETVSGLDVIVEGEAADGLPRNEENLCIAGAQSVFKAANRQTIGLSTHIQQQIPVSRGLGSSAAAIVAGAVGANELMGQPLNTSELLKLCTKIEGHPDNVVPSLLGGLSISGTRAETLVHKTFHVPKAIQAIIAIPDFRLDTKTARGVIPNAVSIEDAVYNLCSVGMLVGGMLTEDYDMLKHGMADRIHQPYRQHLIPGFEEIVRDALAAGAHGAALSGAGPTVIAFATDKHELIGKVMIEAFGRHGISGKYKILPFDNEGCQVLTD